MAEAHWPEHGGHAPGGVVPTGRVRRQPGSVPARARAPVGGGAAMAWQHGPPRLEGPERPVAASDGHAGQATTVGGDRHAGGLDDVQLGHPRQLLDLDALDGLDVRLGRTAGSHVEGEGAGHLPVSGPLDPSMFIRSPSSDWNGLPGSPGSGGVMGPCYGDSPQPAPRPRGRRRQAGVRVSCRSGRPGGRMVTPSRSHGEAECGPGRVAVEAGGQLGHRAHGLAVDADDHVAGPAARPVRPPRRSSPTGPRPRSPTSSTDGASVTPSAERHRGRPSRGSRSVRPRPGRARPGGRPTSGRLPVPTTRVEDPARPRRRRRRAGCRGRRRSAGRPRRWRRIGALPGAGGHPGEQHRAGVEADRAATAWAGPRDSSAMATATEPVAGSLGGEGRRPVGRQSMRRTVIPVVGVGADHGHGLLAGPVRLDHGDRAGAGHHRSRGPR